MNEKRLQSPNDARNIRPTCFVIVFCDIFPLKMVIFHSYVSLPEGKQKPLVCGF